MTFTFCGKCGKSMKEFEATMPMCWDCYYKQEDEEHELEEVQNAGAK